VRSLAAPLAHAALTDVELMARARAGDSQAFGELVHRHHRVLYRSALSMVRSVADAEDVTQCAWIQAYRHVTQFEGSANVRTWLVAIVRNQAIDHLRTRLRHAWRDESASPSRLANMPSPEDVLLYKEQQARLVRAVATLPPRLRMPLRLWRCDRYSYKEMAQMTGVAVGTVKSRVWEERWHVILSCRSTLTVTDVE